MSQIHERFLSYLRETFSLSEKELQKYQETALQPLKKSIRFNGQRVDIKKVKKRLEGEGWKFTKTPVAEVFYVDRDNTNMALGNTEEHIAGDIYIQEVAASHSVDLLRKTCKKDPQLILDMCASPGGKTTQLVEYFPGATIIANEPSRDRLSQLYTNLDRMGHANIVVTNMDGRRFGEIAEQFDAIVIDAPCSGEGTAYKHGDILKFWHIKNIKRIAKLQSYLLTSGVHGLMKGGTLIYSTCTINTLENEGVIEKVMKKLNSIMKLTHHHRFWPQKEGMGGFFISSLHKENDIPEDMEREGELYIRQSHIEPLQGKKRNIVHDWFQKEVGIHMESIDGYFYTYEKDIYFSAHNIDSLLGILHLTKAGVTIGFIQDDNFEPTHQCMHILNNHEKVLSLRGVESHSRIHEYLTTGKTSYGASMGDGRWKMEDSDTGDCLQNGYYELITDATSHGTCYYENGLIHSCMNRKLWRRV